MSGLSSSSSGYVGHDFGLTPLSSTSTSRGTSVVDMPIPEKPVVNPQGKTLTPAASQQGIDLKLDEILESMNAMHERMAYVEGYVREMKPIIEVVSKMNSDVMTIRPVMDQLVQRFDHLISNFSQTSTSPAALPVAVAPTPVKKSTAGNKKKASGAKTSTKKAGTQMKKKTSSGSGNKKPVTGALQSGANNIKQALPPIKKKPG